MLTKKQLDEILEVVFENADHEIEVNGPQDYTVHNYIPENLVDYVWSSIQYTMNTNKSIADLQELFDLQRALQKKIDFNTMSLIQYIRLMFIGIVTEACEALECVNWKPWKQSKTQSQEELKKEIVDIWHFLINLTMASGMDAEEILKRFKTKNKINMQRQEDEY